ncbi:MAG: VWA domain-containing protein [Candidatus ainarchaeum sp.]|nr:VWA domain-containing protein [Candidatus ainarchaeum sp.]
MKKTLIMLGFVLLAAAAYATPLLLIIDSSGSMDETLASGKTKLETAKAVAIDTVNSYNDEIALMVYTDCDSGGDPLTGSISVWQGFTTSKSDLISKINSITADSSTPIANSIIEGTTYLQQTKGTGQMVLLTDGEETCNGDVVSAVEAAQAAGMSVKVVGFALDNSSQADISSSVTQGGGKYYNAGDELELRQAFNEAVSDGSTCCVPTALLLLPLAAGLYLRLRIE